MARTRRLSVSDLQSHANLADAAAAIVWELLFRHPKSAELQVAHRCIKDFAATVEPTQPEPQDALSLQHA